MYVCFKERVVDVTEHDKLCNFHQFKLYALLDKSHLFTILIIKSSKSLKLLLRNCQVYIL